MGLTLVGEKGQPGGTSNGKTLVGGGGGGRNITSKKQKVRKVRRVSPVWPG